MEQVNETAELRRKANLGFTGWLLETFGFARKSKVKILNIDYSPEAIKSSTALTHNLGISAVDMTFSLSSASDLTSLKEYDVVFLAALVGSTQEEKEKVLEVVVSKMTVGALVVIRSVAGMRGLCYPAFDATTEAVAACIDVGVTVDPGTRVVNSVVVGRVRARK
jgi:nicotianamine synthase